MAFRVSLGVSLALVGLDHYLNISMFSGMVAGGLGPIEMLGKLWAYILPLLQIVGGLWFAIDSKSKHAGMILGVALGSIAIGMMLKPILSDTMITDVMPATQNALFWLLFTVVAVSLGCKKD